MCFEVIIIIEDLKKKKKRETRTLEGEGAVI